MSLNGKTVKGLALFAGFPEALVVDIVNCLRFSICLQYDVVMLEGQIGHSMFFVRAGSCQVIFLRDPSNIIAELGVGSHFGEIAMVAPVGKNIRTSTVVTAEKCELNELCRPDLMMCLKNYPTERMAFFDVSFHPPPAIVPIFQSQEDPTSQICRRCGVEIEDRA